MTKELRWNSGLPFYSGAEERDFDQKRRMDCAAMAAIERRWAAEQDFGDSVFSHWALETRRRRRGFARVEIWRRRASSSGGFDWCDRENGATSKIATGGKT